MVARATAFDLDWIRGDAAWAYSSIALAKVTAFIR